MGVHVDEPRGDHQPFGVKDLIGLRQARPILDNVFNPVIFDQQAAGKGGFSGAVDNTSISK